MKKKICRNRLHVYWGRTGLALLSCLIFSGQGVDAQSTEGSSKPQPPPGPVLNPAPNPGQWTITYSYPEDRDKSLSPSPKSATPPPPALGKRPRKVTDTKSRDITREVTVDLNGASTENWYGGSVLYRKDATDNVWDQITPGVNAATDRGYSPLPANGFRDLFWVTADTYVGTTKMEGRTCLVFIPGAPAHFDLTRTDLITSMPQVALIDMETRLPVQMQTDGIIRSYQFVDAPDGFALPPDLLAQFKKAAEGRARLNMR